MADKRPSLGDLLQLVNDELEESIWKPSIHGYGTLEYPEQNRFHCSDAVGRFISGGNRAGKTTAAVVEAVWWATGTHPFLTRPEKWGKGPLSLRFVVVDVSKGIEQIVLPELKRWIPNSYLVNDSWEKSWDKANFILTFKNGSTIDFVTWGMETKKLGGVKRHIVFFDEEPPQAVFNETLMRLMDFGGRWVIAGSPVDGMTWSYDLLWEPSVEGRLHGIDTFQLRQQDNPYLQTDGETRNQYFIGMSEEERSIRESGEFVAKQGLVFPKFNKEIDSFVYDEMIVPPRTWDWYSSVDFGYNNATAWLWHAVGPQGQIFTFGEHYASKLNVEQHCPIVKERELGWGKSPEIRVGDPNNGNAKIGNTGTSYIMEYATRGIYIGTENIPRDVMIGVEKMQEYLRILPESPWGKNRPMWVISPNCPNFIREMKKLRWATYTSDKTAYEMNRREEIHKKDDHAFDSARYFATQMPSLTPIPAASRVQGPPITLSYSELMYRIANDPEVSYVDDYAQDVYTNSEEPDWVTTEAW